MFFQKIFPVHRWHHPWYHAPLAVPFICKISPFQSLIHATRNVCESKPWRQVREEPLQQTFVQSIHRMGKQRETSAASASPPPSGSRVVTGRGPRPPPASQGRSVNALPRVWLEWLEVEWGLQMSQQRVGRVVIPSTLHHLSKRECRLYSRISNKVDKYLFLGKVSEDFKQQVFNLPHKLKAQSEEFYHKPPPIEEQFHSYPYQILLLTSPAINQPFSRTLRHDKKHITFEPPKHQWTWRFMAWLSVTLLMTKSEQLATKSNETLGQTANYGAGWWWRGSEEVWERVGNPSDERKHWHKKKKNVVCKRLP